MQGQGVAARKLVGRWQSLEAARAEENPLLSLPAPAGCRVWYGVVHGCKVQPRYYCSTLRAARLVGSVRAHAGRRQLGAAFSQPLGQSLRLDSSSLLPSAPRPYSTPLCPSIPRTPLKKSAASLRKVALVSSESEPACSAGEWVDMFVLGVQNNQA